MIDNTIPPTPEEVYRERQAKMNAAKEEQRAKLSPEEAQRLTVIESVSSQLEAAGIPFLLMADSTTPDRALDRSCWWQFNKMGYEADFDLMAENSRDRIFTLLKSVLTHMSRAITGGLLWIGSKGQPIGGANEGEWYWAQRPDDKP